MTDFLTQANALAVRYGPAIVTPPAGESPIKRVGVSSLLAGNNRPVVLSQFPTIIIFPADGQFKDSSGTTGGGGGGLRVSHSDWLVEFYYRLYPNPPTHPAQLLDWLSKLVNLPHVAAAQLNATVDHVSCVGWSIPRSGLVYAGTTYEGIRLNVHMRSSESWTPTAA